MRFVAVRPGKPVMYPESRACCSVERDGEKRAAWEKAIMSANFVGDVTALQEFGAGDGSVL